MTHGLNVLRFKVKQKEEEKKSSYLQIYAAELLSLCEKILVSLWIDHWKYLLITEKQQKKKPNAKNY